ncbi:MAG: sugar ABC transporter permease [Acidimicrobiaceae bacterium]|nr:sugar ABC transporter permease [Acidimicrobiaceae bacterium]MXW77022.1 sugar ABC transporter permease [Acidimicrobiaceae bacterium]MYA74857.1 sugar ABC transporter permease [Acidimicrobiaceae bacterium]MYC43654.1 sugar ABC transporter permease [Acidimicrobiaceae bacterium]MYD05685.1 sugar ABC transporter permease [Acidimicrobiaceae bacterium]
MQGAILSGEDLSKIISTLVLIVVAVGASASLWIGVNLLFNQVRTSWTRFNALAGYAVGFLLLLLLQGNRLLKPHGPDADSITRLGELLWTPLLGALIFSALAVILANNDDQTRRLWIASGSGLLLGGFIGIRLAEDARPELEILPLLLSTIVIAGIGAGIALLRGRNPVPAALIGVALGWLIGGFGVPELGDGSALESAIAAAVPGLAIGARIGLTKNAGVVGRARIDAKSRGAIFLVPALFFVTVSLIAPTLITIWLSLKDEDSVDLVWFENYGSVFTDINSFDVGNWTNIFTSLLFVLGVLVGLGGLAIGLVLRKRTGDGFSAGGPAFAPLMIAMVMIVFGVLSVLRGTIMNNLWWVFTVTVFSTGLGLAIAVLADRAKLESVAKSIIFMPMAISLVGASIIWRLVYVARDTSKSQTGLMNAVWVELGRWSTGSGLPTVLGTVLVWVLVALGVASISRSLTSRTYDKIPLRALATIVLLWIAYRFTFDGIGGFRTNSAGETVPDTIFFVQDQPFNNVWLMVILIWIQTGFAMVIMSAAIKAVPTELIEAAKVDGATESQVFWRVTLPQIRTTIGVVVTTLIVLVMKVYDIVKVVTNGNFGSQVLANDMFEEAFLFSNTGVGAALAVILFVSVLPVMVLNIRRMQREA